jgi:ornithine cyclodeaminase
VFAGKNLNPGIHINAIGVYRSTTREIDDETIKQATIVVDTFEGCLTEAGDLLIPMKKGKLTREIYVI